MEHEGGTRGCGGFCRRKRKVDGVNWGLPRIYIILHPDFAAPVHSSVHGSPCSFVALLLFLLSPCVNLFIKTNAGVEP